MLVDTDSDTKADPNSEACLREVDSDTLFETDSEFKTDTDALDDTEPKMLVDAEVDSEACLF